MSDFGAIGLQLNTGTQSTPVWTDAPTPGAPGVELRVSASQVPEPITTSSASWPSLASIPSVQGMDYLYLFTDDTTGALVTGGAFTTANYLQARWSWDAVGTFAAAPVLTAYDNASYASPAANAPARGDGGLLNGQVSDTGDVGLVPRSYLKAALYGSGVTTQVPTGGPATPAAGNGAAGQLSATSGAWSAWQGLMGDADQLVYGATPAPTMAQVLYVMYRLFVGPHLHLGLALPCLALRYAHT